MIRALEAWEVSQVASFTDAWIETALVLQVVFMIFVASFTDAWIETYH